MTTYPRNSRALTFALAALCGGAAFADEEEGLFPIFIVDSTTDQVCRGSDGDEDRTYNGPGEMVVFYDDTIGSLAIDTPTSLHTSPDDYLFISDSSLQRILTMEDLDDDGTCHDPGEHSVYVDGSNASGVGLPHLNSVYVRFLGQIWATSSNLTLAENDAILRFQDLNSDGDANDLGEAVEYYVPALGGAVGDSDPSAVILHPDGLIYYLENGSTGAIAKGVYVLDDLNSNGVIEAPGEVAPFYLPTGIGLDLVSLDVDEHGVVYVGDDGNDQVFRLEDLNGDGAIAVGSEDCIWYTAGSVEVSLDLAVSNDGHEVMALESTASPESMWLMEDEDDDCSIAAFERNVAYDDAAGSVSWGTPTGVDWDFHGHEAVGTAYCFGVRDRCPCSNDDSSMTGCRNSTGSGGLLEGEGTAGIALDDLEFHALQMPSNTPAILFQGNNQTNGGIGLTFFDGLLCASGSTRRLGVQNTSGTGEAMWGPGLLAGPGLWAAGDTRNFQVWYRDPSGPCGTGANTTNAVAITFEQ